MDNIHSNNGTFLSMNGIDAITELNQDITELNQEIDEFEIRITTNENDIVNFRDRITTNENDIDGDRIRITANENRLDIVEDDIQQIESLVSNKRDLDNNAFDEIITDSIGSGHEGLHFYGGPVVVDSNLTILEGNELFYKGVPIENLFTG